MRSLHGLGVLSTILVSQSVAAATVLLRPAQFVNTQTFRNPTVIAFDPGQLVFPMGFTNTQAFRSPLVSHVTAQALHSTKFSNTQTFRNATVATGDPLFANVAFLGHFIGSDGQTTQTDKSVNARTITMSNGAKIDAGVQLFGDNTGLKDGTNDLVTAPSDANWWGANQSMCMEGWFYFPSTIPSGDRLLMGIYRSVSSGRGLGLFLLTGGSPTGEKIGAYRGSGGVGTLLTSALFSPTLNTWYHLALSRDTATGDFRIFVDGVMLAKTNYTGNLPVPSQAFSIGSQNDGSTQQIAMRFREIRVTVGVPRYNSDAGFTPPAYQLAEST